MAYNLPYMDSNIIDLSLLLSPSPPIALEELTKLKSSLTSWGSIQLINHGMSIELLDEVCNMTKKFFNLPSEVKEKYSKPVDSREGYGADYMPENFPPIHRLFLTIYPEEQKRLDLWPETPNNFRDTMHEYSIKSKKAHDQILQAMARCINLEENSFLKGYGENPELVARVNYYTPTPHHIVDIIRQVSKHSDVSATTFLLTDRHVEGLEVEKDGQWFKVPVIPNAIMVLVGDQLEIMSNGIFKSCEHRVATNPENERVSWAMFFSPDLEKDVRPVDALVTIDRPALYKPVKRYIDVFNENITKGIRPITLVKI